LNTLADLDELVLRCRGGAAKTYITEAVACYRAGAPRAAIVATWVAVLFDFLEKLKELEMTGDAKAKATLEVFEGARGSSNWKASLGFERDVLKFAEIDFELLSPIEAQDLQRLSEDRNRCAHPSMTTSDDPYQPSAELARNHIRNAVTHLLAHPPLQGKAALERLIKDVESEYFPSETADARDYFKTGPMARARTALIRNFIVVLSKALFDQPWKSLPRKRRFAALNAVLTMHIAEGEKALAEILPRLVGAVPDEKWYRVVFYLANIQPSWALLGDAARVKAREYIQKATEEDLFRFMPYALNVPALRQLTENRLPDASTETLARTAKVNSSRELINEVLARLESASSFRGAEKILDGLVIPLASSLKNEDIERACEAFCTNKQVKYAIRVPELLRNLLNASPNPAGNESSWRNVFDTLEGEPELISTAGNLSEQLRNQFGFE